MRSRLSRLLAWLKADPSIICRAEGHTWSKARFDESYRLWFKTCDNCDEVDVLRLKD